MLFSVITEGDLSKFH